MTSFSTTMEKSASTRAELLSRYLDGQLSEEERSSFERRLAEDVRLREELSQWNGMRNRLQGAVQRQPVPDDLAARVLAQTTERSRFTVPSGWRNLRLAAVAAFCLVVLSSVWMLLQQQPYTIEDLPPQMAALMQIGVGKHVACVKERIGTTAFPLGKYNSALPEKYKRMLDAAQRSLPADFKLVELHICGKEGREFAHLTLTRGDGYLSVLLTERREGDPVPNDPELASATVGDVQIYAARRDDMQVAAFTLPTEYAFVVSDYSANENLGFTRDVAAAIQ